MMNIYWGDIHNHCGMTYGYGSLENALKAARGHLDFCSVTGHAMWPDMLTGQKGFEFAEKYHKEGFQKLADNWEYVRETITNENDPGSFVTFQSYEIHSRLCGDYHILSSDDALPLFYAGTPMELAEKLFPRPVIAIPHHVGYTPGYRGCNWEAFNPEISPVAEVYSKHGSGMSDAGAFPYLHTMGPVDSRTTINAGLERGHRFGFTASTDHHAGYPGSYGDGRTAVLAAQCSRRSIWDALLARRTYAVTGDKIRCLFQINGKYMGSVISDEGDREISLAITACDHLDKIIIYKNMAPWRVVNGEFIGKGEKEPSRYKIRVEMGWGREETGYLWEGMCSLNGGKIVSVEPCFRGRGILAPQQDMAENPEINNLENSILQETEMEARWKCTSFKNPTTLHPQTASLIFEIEGDCATEMFIDVNGIKIRKSINELLKGGISGHVKPYNSEAVLVHEAIPETEYKYNAFWKDGEKKRGCDMYHVEVRQRNGQHAWISPIWIEDV